MPAGIQSLNHIIVASGSKHPREVFHHSGIVSACQGNGALDVLWRIEPKQRIETSPYSNQVGSAVDSRTCVIFRKALHAVVRHQEAGDPHLADAIGGYLRQILLEYDPALAQLLGIHRVENGIQIGDRGHHNLSTSADFSSRLDAEGT